MVHAYARALDCASFPDQAVFVGRRGLSHEDKRDVDRRADEIGPRTAPLGLLQGAGNRAITTLLARTVQRDDDNDGQTDTASGGVDTSDSVDDMCQAIRDNVDGAAVADAWRQDAAGQDQGGGGPASAADGTSVQTTRAEGMVVQRDDPPPTPAPPTPAPPKA